MTASAPDLAEAKRFLDLLDPDAEAFTFQTFDDSPLKRGTLARVAHGDLDSEARRLTAWQKGGAGVFVTVNETDGTARKAENVVRVRAVFVDLDGAPLDPALRCELEPHIVVESSPGRWHCYWLADLPLDAFEPVQKAIAARFNGDPAVHDLPRVMRMVGYWHLKGEPFLSRIVQVNQRLPYTAEQILAEFPPLVEEERPKPRSNGAHPDSPFAAINDAALANLPAWVPALFPTARQSKSKTRWRVSSADLGRGLEEDLSITPQGAKYFGIHDMGDARGGRRTPIDLVIEYGAASNAAAAAGWLAARLGIEFRAAVSPEEEEEEHAEEADEKKTKRSIATELVKIALASTELFTTPGDQIGFAAFEIDHHREVWPLRSRGFKTWLGRRLYEETKGKKTASAQAISDALVTIEGTAMFDGATREVYLRVAHHNGRYYLDLADDRWRAVEISAGGWQVIDRPPVYFRRTRGTLPLPEPVPGGSLDPLRKLLNVGTEDDFKILIAWTLAALRPAGPYPVLDLAGEQGSAKSTTARALRELIDPGEPMIRAAPKQERDLAIAVTNAHVLALDNMSDVQPWLSDALCRFSTGGGWACRQLYTDDDQILIDAMKPILINGIEELSLRPDLKDRTVAVVLPTIEEEDRLEEGAFWRDFEAAQPTILGALLDVMAAGLANLPKIRLTRLPRMADFARWIAACEPALGWQSGSFAELYSANRRALGELALEANETIRMIRDNAICHDEHENVGSLLEKLRVLCSDDRARLKELPKTRKALGGLLRRYAPELRTAGLDVIFGKHGRAGYPVTLRERVRAQRSQWSHGHEVRASAGLRRDHWRDRCDGADSMVTATVTEKANEFNHHDHCDRCDRSAGTPRAELTLEDLDRMAGETWLDDPAERDNWTDDDV